MDTELLFWTKVGFIVLSLVLILLVHWGLYLVLKKTHYSSQKRKNIFLGTIAFTVFWLTLISILSIKGFFLKFDTLPPRMLVVLLPPLIKILFLTFSGRMDHILSVTPPQWLLYIQAFRIPVELLLWMLLLSGAFPEHLTFEGRNWDVIAGILSPIVGYLCFVKKKYTVKTAILWNLLGLGLLLNIVVMAVLTLPTPFQYYKEGLSNEIVATFPVIFLPAVLVVGAYTFHAFSIRQLMKMK